MPLSSSSFESKSLCEFKASLGDNRNLSAVRPIFLEVCAGSAILSFYVHTLSAGGVQVVPIDHAANQHSPKMPILKIDLRDAIQVEIIIELIQSGLVAAAHFAVPCGTCSRAREIPVPGGGGPRPLRSESKPLGLEGLYPAEQARVDCANEVYNTAFKLIDVLIEASAVIVIENPDRSIFWHFPRAVELLSKGFSDVRFQHCKWTMLKSMRAKWVRLRTNCAAFEVLEGPCHVQHTHLKWGISDTGHFNTSFEAEYPSEMATVMADIFNTEMALRGFVNAKPDAVCAIPVGKRIRAATSKQPRGKAIPALISEFKDVVKCKRGEAQTKQYKIVRSLLPLNLLLEKGGHIDASGGTSSTDRPENNQAHTLDDEVVAGIFRAPEEFVECAMKLKHPVDTFLDQVLPAEIVEAIAFTFRSGPTEIAQHRTRAVRELVKLLQDEAEADDAVFKGMDALMAKVLHGKKLHTTSILAKKWQFKDENIVNDMMVGFKLTGMQPFFNAFKHEIRIPEATEESLRRNSGINNKLAVVRTKSSGEPDIDVSFYEQALLEVTKGWLIGPFRSLEEYERELGHCPHVSRRFPLDQSDKVRSIDDMLESGINTTFGCHDKLVLHDVDFVASVIKSVEKLIAGAGTLVDEDGTSVPIPTHSAWKQGATSISAWVGKTIDLSEAYKQCATHPQSRWSAAVTVFCPKENIAHIFGQATLPFGSAAAVLAFNRMSRLLYFLGTKELRMIWSSFFDDFSTLAPEVVATLSSTSAILLLKLLGWRVADKPGKDQPWSKLFTTLGVVFDISRISESLSTVGNKEERKRKLIAQLNGLITEKFASAKTCESIRGKLTYSDSQVFGRASKGKLKALDRGPGKGKNFSEFELSQLQWLVRWLEESPPRQITSRYQGPPLVLFTDGACEPLSNDAKGSSLTTCGAVLLDPRTKTALVFGIRIRQELTDQWESLAMKKQLVTEAELLPQLLARRTWEERIKGVKLLSFIDSEPSKFSLIRGTSESQTCADIVSAVAMFDSLNFVWSWYSRVPTWSNIADAPSRLEKVTKILDYEVVYSEPEQPVSLQGGLWISA